MTKIVKAKPIPRGKNQRILAGLKPGEGVIVANRTKANSMCETATQMGIKIGTQVQEDRRILVWRKS
jgi:hypothetical protein